MNKYFLVAFLVVGLTLTGVYAEDHREKLGVDFKVEGNLEPKEGYSFPKEWGRLVSHQVIVTGFTVYGGGGSSPSGELFTFEADDGTIRIVRLDLNWKHLKIDDIKVLTIGRHSLPESAISP